MAGSGGGELRAPIFNGENFDFWQIRMKTIFRSHELWNIVEMGFLPPAKAEGEIAEAEMKLHRENLVKDARALGIIQGAVIAYVIENTRDIDVIDAQDVVAILKGYELRLTRHEENSTERAFSSLDISSKNSKVGNQFTNTDGSKSQKKFKFKGKQWTNRFIPGVRNKANNYEGACKYCDKLHYGECWLKGKIKCHKCGKLGHIARVCNLNKNVQQGNFANKVVEQKNFTNKMGEPGNLFMVKQSTEVKAVSDAWYIDSACSNHMTSREELLVEIDRSIKAKVQVGTWVLVDVKGKGTLVIDTDKGKRYIREVMLVPGIAENLLSVGQMTEHGYFMIFGDYKVDIFYDRTLTNLVVSVKQKGNRCFPLVFKSNDHLVLKTNVHQSSTMWHKRFGHLNYRSLQQLQEHDMVLGLPEMHDSEDVCQGCAFGKNHRVSFPKESVWRARMLWMQIFSSSILDDFAPTKQLAP
ncbi:unnamed protein product [Malus baccata var. baccata]